jgi:deoxyadenosine/deoxycytidine kinase
MLDKDPLFAQMTLDDDEFKLYRKVFSSLAISEPPVDLMIYLQAPVDVLQERVHKRRVRYEMGMDLAYLKRLSDAYTRYFHHYNRSALLIVNAAQINPVDDVNHYNALVRRIDQIEGGKHFFNPLA